MFAPINVAGGSGVEAGRARLALPSELAGARTDSRARAAEAAPYAASTAAAKTKPSLRYRPREALIDIALSQSTPAGIGREATTSSGDHGVTKWVPVRFGAARQKRTEASAGRR